MPTKDSPSSSSTRVSPAANSLSRITRTSDRVVTDIPEVQEVVCRRPFARMQSKGEAVGVAQNERAVGIAPSLSGIEGEVALVEAAGTILVGDADPDMSEAHCEHDKTSPTLLSDLG